jgi:hypothetical protein
MAVSSAYARYLRSRIDFADAGATVHIGLAHRLEERCKSVGNKKALEQAHRTRRILNYALFSNVVDNFQTYLAEILYQIFETKPEIFSGKQIPAKWLFDEPDLDSLKRRLIEKNILDLGYKSIDDLVQYFENNHSIEMVNGEFAKIRLSLIIQIRNLIAHNRGVVNSVFVFKTGTKRLSLGDYVRQYDPIYTNRWLTSVAQNLDAQVVSKIGVPSATSEEFDA